MILFDYLKILKKKPFFLKIAFLAFSVSAFINPNLEIMASHAPEESDEALYTRGLTLRNEKKYEEAKTCFQPLAEKGDMKARHNLGLCCFYLGEAYQAYSYFSSASEQGLQASKNNLGKMNLFYLLLPDEVLKRIVSFLSFQDLKSFRAASEKSYALATFDDVFRSNIIRLTLDTPKKINDYLVSFPCLKSPIRCNHFKFKGTREQLEKLVQVWMKKDYTHHIKIASSEETQVGCSIIAFHFIQNETVLDFSRVPLHSHNFDVSFETLILPSQDPGLDLELSPFRVIHPLESLISLSQLYEENLEDPVSIFSLDPILSCGKKESLYEAVILSTRGIFLNRGHFPRLYHHTQEEEGLEEAVRSNIGCPHCLPLSFVDSKTFSEDLYRFVLRNAQMFCKNFLKERFSLLSPVADSIFEEQLTLSDSRNPKKLYYLGCFCKNTPQLSCENCKPSTSQEIFFPSGDDFDNKIQPILDTLEGPALLYQLMLYKDHFVLAPRLLWPQHFEAKSRNKFLFRSGELPKI